MLFSGRLLGHFGEHLALVAVRMHWRTSGAGQPPRRRLARAPSQGAMFCLVVLLGHSDQHDHQFEVWSYTHLSTPHLGNAAVVHPDHGRPHYNPNQGIQAHQVSVQEDLPVYRDNHSQRHFNAARAHHVHQGQHIFWLDAATMCRWTPPASPPSLSTTPGQEQPYVMVVYYFTSTRGLLPSHLCLMGLGGNSRCWLPHDKWPKW